jgi:small redox-active disulfide protein 2
MKVTLKMMKIEILGTGCPKCKLLEENTKKAVLESGVKAEIIKVTDIEKIIGYGVMSTPALAIDGKIKCYGRIADIAEIKKFLK